ncbi:DUF397 domain-containing protein [Streptomyces sp. NBC_00704]|uniref:DUF397 domain-containing protein n=1 Tax=Streptomyces sp. NBC_00704 TaxID=2975809 RepID=UPI002E37E8C4|nr:DUF397 domain-containing protein [Streptomyces sp. NBC_00704]
MGSNVTLAGIQWRKSSHSGDQGGECVEVAALPAAIAVRDSKSPAGPVLTVEPAVFSEFVRWTTAAG